MYQRLADGKVQADARTGEEPFRRTVGGTLRVFLEYEGDAADGYDGQEDLVKCDIHVEFEDTWGSLGSRVASEHEREAWWWRSRHNRANDRVPMRSWCGIWCET